MKEYIRPEMNIELFKSEDIIRTSEMDETSGRKLKTKVNGNEGTNYGSQEISIFD